MFFPPVYHLRVLEIFNWSTSGMTKFQHDKEHQTTKKGDTQRYLELMTELDTLW